MKYKIECKDNLEMLRNIPGGKVNLHYWDILYGTNSKDIKDYNDCLFKTPQEALDFYRPRFEEMYRTLSSDGSVYIHCDWHLSHYLKVLLDEIFGYDNFRNDIIRQCTNAKNNSKNWGKIYDNILYYVKDNSNYVFNSPTISKTDNELTSQYNKLDKDGNRYTTVPLHAKGETKSGETGKDWNSKSHGLIKLPPGRHWATSHDWMDRLDGDGLIEWSKNGNPRKILYANDYLEKPVQNILNLKSIGGNEYYQTSDYDTQKPLELLRLIIQTSSNENDLVCDMFLGSGTTAIACQELNRNFIGCDINQKAVDITLKRLASN
jgi:adenine-specific DNA-methyltransferase